MLQAVVSAVFLFSFVTALFQGTMESSCARLLSAPEQAVELIVSIGCGICFWSGVMEVARQSGLLKGLAKLFSPILSLLFPKCKKDSPAAQAICLNLAANLMGLGAAAAPAGICAVRELQKSAPDPTVAAHETVLVILLNTASMQLIPTTAAMLRLKAGAANPMEILPAVWISSLISITAGLSAAAALSAVLKKRRL